MVEGADTQGVLSSAADALLDSSFHPPPSFSLSPSLLAPSAPLSSSLLLSALEAAPRCCAVRSSFLSSASMLSSSA
eukprot:6204208-Pleurochrysis_carterae.AAC.2